jgi:F-type H+-transporting ATPase subunit b
MNINATLFGQMLVFVVLIWFTMKFIWPYLTNAIEERQKKIADGLAAADRGQKDLVEAKDAADDIIREAREKAGKIVDQANKRSTELIEEARSTALSEGQRLVADARQEIELEKSKAREQLRNEVVALALAGTSRLLEREVDPRTHAELLEKLAVEVEQG